MGVNQIFERTLFLKCLIYGEFTLPVAEQQARRFSKPKTEEEVAKARKASIPKKTLADTK